MDRVGADFDRTVEMMVARLSANPVPIQLPLGREDGFLGVIDLVEMKAVRWANEELGAKFEDIEIPDEYRDLALSKRERMVEQIAETDDELLEKYLSGAEVTDLELKAALRRATIANRLQPVLCGSAFKNKGVQPLLDAVVDYLPAPIDLPPVEGTVPDSGEVATRASDPSAPFSALVFKIMTDPFVGQLAYLRVYSGRLESGSRFTTRPRPARSEWVACSRCTPTSAKRSPMSKLATSSQPWVSKVSALATPSVSRPIRSSSKR